MNSQVAGENDYCDLEGVLSLDDVEEVGTNRRLRECQERFRAKKCQVPPSVANMSQVAIKLANE